MPKPITIKGRVTDGREPTPTFLRNLLSALGHWAGKDCEVTVKSRTRSLSANAFYWGVVLPAVKEVVERWGYDLEPQDIHDKMMKPWFLPARVVEVPSKEDPAVVVEETIYGSTRTDEHTFADFIWKIEHHPPFVEGGLFIERPEGKLSGRTIHEPGGTKITFADPAKAEPMSDEPYAEPAGAHAGDGPGPIHSEAEARWAASLGMDEISEMFANQPEGR